MPLANTLAKHGCTGYNLYHMEEINQKFKGEVLTKVYKVWLVRKLLPVLIGEVLILALLLYSLGRVIFIERVLDNALNVVFLSPPKILPFFGMAFMRTSLNAKFLGLGVALFIALLIRHITQGILRLFLVKQNYFAKLKPES